MSLKKMNEKIKKVITAGENLLGSDIAKSARHKCLEIELRMQIEDIKSEPINDRLEQLILSIESNFNDSELEMLRAIANGMLWSEETYDAVYKLADFISKEINQSWNEIPNYSKQKQIV